MVSSRDGLEHLLRSLCLPHSSGKFYMIKLFLQALPFTARSYTVCTPFHPPLCPSPSKLVNEKLSQQIKMRRLSHSSKLLSKLLICQEGGHAIAITFSFSSGKRAVSLMRSSAFLMPSHFDCPPATKILLCKTNTNKFLGVERIESCVATSRFCHVCHSQEHSFIVPECLTFYYCLWYAQN